MVRAPAVLVVATLLIAIPIGGCVGEGSGGPSTTTADDDTSAASGNATETNATEAGARPHVHDRWSNPASGAEISEVKLVDRTVTLSAFEASPDNPAIVDISGCPYHREGRPCYGSTSFRPGTWSNGDDKIVPPGTARVAVTVSFNPDDFGGIDFLYQHRNRSGEWALLTDDAHGGPFQPGETKTINVTVQMADDGHAQVSAWKFAVQPVGDPVTGQTNDIADVGDGEVQVTVVAERSEGTLPVEPPHPDFWEEDDPPTDTYLVGRLSGSTEGVLQAGGVHWEHGRTETPSAGFPGLIWEIPVGFEGRRIDDSQYPPKLLDTYATALVPPGTSVLAVRVTVEGASVDAAQPGLNLCVVGQDIPGGGFPHESERLDKLIGDCQEFGTGTFTFRETLTHQDTDSLYTDTSANLSASRWTLYVQVVAGKAAGNLRGVANWDGELSAQAYVTDQPGFELPEWADTGGS